MNPSCHAVLSRGLAKLKRLAVVGIGNDLYGDDAAGVIVARRLQTALAGRRNVLIVDAGSVPENCTGPLRRFKPDGVLLVDAAQMDARPGEVRCLNWQDIVGLNTSTHTFPLHVLAGYLSRELRCPVFVVGIQPEDAAFDKPLSPSVRAAVDALIPTLVALLS